MVIDTIHRRLITVSVIAICMNGPHSHEEAEQVIQQLVEEGCLELRSNYTHKVYVKTDKLAEKYPPNK